MGTAMDENTVTANLVTFVNCLSLSERRSITKYLFCNKDFYINNSECENDIKISEFEQIISKAKKVEWKISYHTQVFPRCEPDIVVNLDKEKFYIEVKTNYGARLTESEKINGARELYGLKENHLYLVPDNYDLTDKIPSSPVCKWSQLKEFMYSEEINCERFFKEIGKYIDCFEQNISCELTKGDVFMLFKPEEMRATLSLINKLSLLLQQTKNSIQQELTKLGITIGNPTGPLQSFCQISINGQKIGGYGFNNWVFNDKTNDNNLEYAFSIWFENKDYWNEKDKDKCKLIYRTELPFYKIDEKVLNGTEEQMKEAFSKEVVRLFESYLKI